jgi:hypothetical protein
VGAGQALIGPQAETLVWLYCTVSQRFVYRQVRQLAACFEEMPAEGLLVRNCHTGQRQRLPREWAARLLVLLAADLAEQVRVPTHTRLRSTHTLRVHVSCSTRTTVSVQPRALNHGLMLCNRNRLLMPADSRLTRVWARWW